MSTASSGRPLRPAARRLRAGHEDGRHGDRPRRPEGRAAAARRRFSSARRASTTRFFASGSQPTSSAPWSAGCSGRLPMPGDSWRLDETTHPFQIGLSPTDVRLTTRYDEQDLEARGLLRAARIRARPVRERRRPGTRRLAARAAELARPARVAEPHVGEPRRAKPAVLAALLPVVRKVVPERARRHRPGGLLPRRQQGRARR